MRRVAGAIAAVLLLSAALVAPPAAAQETAITLRLLSQSPWCAAYQKGKLAGKLDLKLQVFNGGATPLRDLSLQVVFGPRITTQAEFQEMLSVGVPSAIETATKTVHGEIAAGGDKHLEIIVDLGNLGALDQTDSQVYPAAVQLVSGGTVVASLVTPVIYLIRAPLKPMLSNVSVQLPAPIAFGADGTLVDASFPASVAEGGTLQAPLQAVKAVTGGRNPHGVMDLVVDPLAITQARDLADGYRTLGGTDVPQGDPTAKQAERFIRQLAAATSNPDTVETVALPFADPVVPAMIASGLSGELAVQRSAGATVVAGLSPATDPIGSVAQPAEGRLSDGALDWMAQSRFADIVLADAGTVDRSPWQGQLAPAPTVPFTSSSGSLTMVLPDPPTQALFDDTLLTADPVRASQVVLGELALIWKQSPVPAPGTERGVAVAPPPTLPPTVWAPLLARLNDAPFLTPVTATQLVDQVVPPNPNGNAVLTAPDSTKFDDTYAADLDRLTRTVEAYGSMLPIGSPVPTDLRRQLFMATAPPYLSDPEAGRPWLTSVDDTTTSAITSVLPDARPRTFTFTSREGTIPIVMGDPGPTPLQVIVELQSTSFTFPEGNRKTVTVDQPGQVVSFRVVAETSGQNPIYLFVRAPNGRQLPEPSPGPLATILVRSTAVNHIALLITIAAALGLVALYSRRWFRRRRSPT